MARWLKKGDTQSKDSWVSTPPGTGGQIHKGLLSPRSLQNLDSVDRRSSHQPPVSARGRMQHTIFARPRPVVGRDLSPLVGQRVVGIGPFETLGLGTVIDTEDCSPGTCTVRWDTQQNCVHESGNFCIGRNSVYHLELATEEDEVLGMKFCMPRIEDRVRRHIRTTGNISARDEPQEGIEPVFHERTKKGHSKQFLKKRTGVRYSMAKYHETLYNKTLLDLFHRFARGSRRKRFSGHENKKIKKQNVESIDLSELTELVHHLNTIVDRPFMPMRLTWQDIQNQYNAYTPWSTPDASSELDFESFCICLESIAMLAGVPFLRFCNFGPDHEHHQARAAANAFQHITPESTQSLSAQSVDQQQPQEPTVYIHRPLSSTKSKPIRSRVQTTASCRLSTPFIPSSHKDVCAAVTARLATARGGMGVRAAVGEEELLAVRKMRAREAQRQLVERIQAEHKAAREMEQSRLTWSRKFILTSDGTPWYQGPQIKFWVYANSQKELAEGLVQKVHRLLDFDIEKEPLTVKYNVTPRSNLLRGAAPKWVTVDLKSEEMAQLPGRLHLGTFLRVLREQDVQQAKDRAHQLWLKMRRVVKSVNHVPAPFGILLHVLTRGHDGTRELRLQKRAFTFGGIAAVAHQTLLRTLQTGGAHWIQGDVHREQLKEALHLFLAKLDRAPDSDDESDTHNLAIIRPLLDKAKFLSIRTGVITFNNGVEHRFRASTSVGTCRHCMAEAIWAEGSLTPAPVAPSLPSSAIPISTTPPRTPRSPERGEDGEGAGGGAMGIAAAAFMGRSSSLLGRSSSLVTRTPTQGTEISELEVDMREEEMPDVTGKCSGLTSDVHVDLNACSATSGTDSHKSRRGQALIFIMEAAKGQSVPSTPNKHTPRPILANSDSAAALLPPAPPPLVKRGALPGFEDLSWQERAKLAAALGAAAVIFISHLSELKLPPEVLDINVSLELSIPIVFVPRGTAGDAAMAAGQNSHTIVLMFDAPPSRVGEDASIGGVGS